MPDDFKVKAYVAAVSSLGLGLLFSSLPFLPFEEWHSILLFAVLCGIAQSMPVCLSRSSAVSVSPAFTFAGLVLFGPVAAIWINLGSSIVAAFRPRRKPLHKVLFNVSNHSLAAVLAGIFYLGSGGTIHPGQPITAVYPILVSGAVYFLVQTLLLSGAISLTERLSFVRVWEANFRWSTFNFIGLAVVGLGIAIGEQSLGLVGIAIFFIPLVMAWYSFRLYMDKSKEVRLQNEALRQAGEKLEKSYVDTIRALAIAVDVKDHYTHGHSETAMRFAVATARELGLSESETAAVQVAALFHDVGKLAVPDRILHKPTELTEEEWKIVREHPITGANLIQRIDGLSAATPGVLSHHERYDGKGYPSGLQGDRIPMAAQIVAVADAFQGMTSARPYRAACSQTDALEELRRCAGTQFNPRVVDAFVKAIKTGGAAKDVALPSLGHLFPQEAMVQVHSN